MAAAGRRRRTTGSCGLSRSTKPLSWETLAEIAARPGLSFFARTHRRILISADSLHGAPKKNIPVVWTVAGVAGRFPAAAAAGTSRRPRGTVIDGYPATAAIDQAAPLVGPTRASSLSFASSASIPSSRVCFLIFASASR
jgi:hypothetical protein